MNAPTETYTLEAAILSRSEGNPFHAEDPGTLECIRSNLEDPRIFQQEPFSQLSDQLHSQSIIIWDAFESVTNGMYDPGLLEQLESIPSSSPFYPWKLLIHSILAFYQDDHENIEILLGDIPDDTPASRMVPVIRSLCKTEDPGINNPAVESFHRLIAGDHTFIRSAAAQLKDCLEIDHAEAFIESVLLIIRDLVPDNPVAARRLGLWGMKTARSRGYVISEYLRMLEEIFGRGESLRLTALALQSEDPDIAVLFWLKYLVYQLDRGAGSIDLLCALRSILSDAASEIFKVYDSAELHSDIEYCRSLESLILKAREEVSRHLPEAEKRVPEFFIPPSDIKDPYEWLKIILGREKEATDDKNRSLKTVHHHRQAAGSNPPSKPYGKGGLQLELFS